MDYQKAKLKCLTSPQKAIEIDVSKDYLLQSLQSTQSIFLTGEVMPVLGDYHIIESYLMLMLIQ
jgi:hypothetical protein